MTETGKTMSVPRCHRAGRQRTRGSLTGWLQHGPGDVQDPRRRLASMNRMYGTPAGPSDGPGPAGQSDPYAHYSPGPPRKGRMLRWGAGVTLAGFLAGGAIALAVSGGSSPAAAVSPSTGVSASSQAEGTALNSAINTAT